MNTVAPVGADSTSRTPMNSRTVSVAGPVGREGLVGLGVLVDVDGTGPERRAATPTTAGGRTGGFVDCASGRTPLVGTTTIAPATLFVGKATGDKAEFVLGNA